MPSVLIFKQLLLPISETFIVAQAEALSAYEPTFVGMRWITPSLPIPGTPLVLWPHTRGRMAGFRTKIYKWTNIAPRFHSALEHLRSDLIHAHFAPDGAVAAELAERLGIPLVVTLHGSDVTTRNDFRRRYLHLWHRADRFICVSEFIWKKAIEAGFPAEKLCVHYIGIDRAKFSPSVKARTKGMVLFVGRLVEKKGCTHLLTAMRGVQLRYPAAHLVVIGDGPLRSSLEQQASSLGLNCNFLGIQAQAVVRDYLERASVFCLPSITAKNGDSEGLPIVVLEALSMGIPVVGTFHAGIPEAVLNGETGLLAKEKDHKALAEHILRFLQDVSFRESCTIFGKEWVASRFDLKKQTNSLESLYTEVVNRSA